jgi:hypothetical protein
MFCLGLDDAFLLSDICHMPHPSHPPQLDHSKQYLVRSTNHEFPHYTIFFILILLLIVPNILPCTILIYALSKTDSMKAVWHRHLAASLMAWRSGFSPRSAKVGFVADIVQLGQDFL